MFNSTTQSKRQQQQLCVTGKSVSSSFNTNVSSVLIDSVSNSFGVCSTMWPMATSDITSLDEPTLRRLIMCYIYKYIYK